MTGEIAYVRADGDPYRVGRQHGAALASALRAFVDDGLCRLNRVMRPAVSMDALLPVIRAHQTEIEAATPNLAEETRGLAAGAGISHEQALLLQLRREIMGYRRVRAGGDCTTYARLGAEPVLAQTVDLNGNLDDHITVLDIALDGAPRRALVLSFAGLLGYLGVNSDGLAVGLNLVVGGRWRPGLPPYLAIRHLLDTAGDVDEAVEILRRLPLASSRSIMLCDPHQAAYVEILNTEQRVVRAAGPPVVRAAGPPTGLAHTNHYLHPDLVPHDELNVFARTSSARRLEACRSGLAALADDAGIADHFALLSQPPIRVPDTGDITLDRTVATVVLLPARGELHVRPGDGGAGSRTAGRTFSLREPHLPRAADRTFSLREPARPDRANVPG
jgi:isopenicillin-N N-acyltransferase like protein